MTNLIRFIKNLRNEEGQGMVEYSLILALVSVVAVGTLTTMGNDVKAVFTSTTGILNSANP